MLERIVSDAPVFLFVAVRCFATIMTLPLFSSRTVPRTAKIARFGVTSDSLSPMSLLATISSIGTEEKSPQPALNETLSKWSV